MSSSLSHFSITKPQQQKDEVTQKATPQKRSQDPARALGSSIADVVKWALSTSIKGQFGETEMGRHRHVWPREETPQGSESADASGASCGRVQEACVCCPCANCMPRPMLCQHLHLGWLFCFYYPSLTPPQTQQKSPKSLRGKGAHSPWCRAPLPPALDAGQVLPPFPPSQSQLYTFGEGVQCTEPFSVTGEDCCPQGLEPSSLQFSLALLPLILQVSARKSPPWGTCLFHPKLK